MQPFLFDVSDSSVMKRETHPHPGLCVSRCIGPIPIPAFPLKGKGTNVKTNSHGKEWVVRPSP